MLSAVPEPLAAARTLRAALAASLSFWCGRADSTGSADHPRYRLDWAGLADGAGFGALLTLTGRETQWTLDLEKEATRLRTCETAAILLRNDADKSWMPCRMGCGSRLCPVCGRTRAARACGHWRPVLTAAAEDGAELRHWTLTQRADSAVGGLVTAAEAAQGWVGPLPVDGGTYAPTAGECLEGAYTRFRGTLRAVRQGRRTRARWRDGLGGYLVGVEWTGQDPRTDVPRWHAHGHVLTVTEPGTTVDERAMLADWAAAAGGSVRAQHVRRVDPSAVVEVLKYPFKSAHLTSAQRIETLAYARGLHPHHIGGSWHGRSADRSDPASCWNRWLAARPEPPVFRRLHHVPEDGMGPELWTGDPSEGDATFALRSDAGWRTWRADAAGYAACLTEADPSAAVALPREPGEDWSDGLFTT